MKKIYLLFSFIAAFVSGVNAQKSWTGSVSTAWNVAGNWDSGVPSSTDAVYIGYCSTCPILSANTTVAGITIESGTLTIGANTLTVNGVFAMIGGNLFSTGGTVDAVRTGGFVFNTITGNLTLKINRNGEDMYLGAMGGGNTFNDEFTLECHTGTSSSYMVANSQPDTYKKKTVLKNIGKGWLMIASNPTSNPTTFQDEVEFINSNTNEGKIQIGEYGGKIKCEKLAKFTDNTTSPYSYITTSEGTFNDEVEVRTQRAQISFGAQNTTIFKKKVTLYNSNDARIDLGSGTGNVTFEATADLAIAASTPMLKGQLRLQQFDFLSDNTTPPLNLILGDPQNVNLSRPNTLIKLGYWGTFNREVNFRADYIQYNLVNFNKNATLERIGVSTSVPSGFVGWGVCPGNSTFLGNATFKNTYGDDWILQAYSRDIFKQNVTLIQGNHAWGVLRPSYTGSTTYEGNIDISMPYGGQNGIVFGENGGASTLLSGKTINVGSFANGFLNFTNFTQLGNTTPQTMPLNAVNLTFSSCEFQSPVTATAARLSLSYSIFYDSFFTKLGNGNDNSIGVNTFKKKVRLKNQSTTGEMRFVYQNSTVSN